MNEYLGILFRIEDVDGPEPNLRSYEFSDFNAYPIDNSNIDMAISKLISDEVNGSKSRILHSYSKSLAACLLKYNKYADNELHIFVDNKMCYNKIFYSDFVGGKNWGDYSIKERIKNYSKGSLFFNMPKRLYLQSFVVDISYNDMLKEYLQLFVGKGLKWSASPEKDKEVVILNPFFDMSIRKYIGTVYVIYALQLKYQFISNFYIRESLINDIFSLYDFRFYYCEQERHALVNIIMYLSYNWNYEKEISKNMYKDFENQIHISSYYDSILQFWDIQRNTFKEVYELISYYQPDVVTSLALKWCCRFLYGKDYI